QRELEPNRLPRGHAERLQRDARFQYSLERALRATECSSGNERGARRRVENSQRAIHRLRSQANLYSTELVLFRILKIDAHEQALSVSAVIPLAHQRALTMHGTGTRIQPVDARSQPLEVRRDFAIDLGTNPGRWLGSKLFGLRLEDRPRQFFGRRQIQQPIYVCQMISE